MTNNKQSGFGIAIIIIIVVVVLAILGYAGYRVYNSQTSKPTGTSNTTTSNNQTNGNTQSSNTQTNNTQNTATYLDIKELGIKIKLSDGIKDAAYSYSAPTSQTYATFGGSAYFSTQTLIDEDAACVSSKGPLGAIVKIAGNTDGFGNVLTADNNTVFKLGNNYYRYEAPQAPCSNNNSVNSLASDQKICLTRSLQNHSTR